VVTQIHYGPSHTSTSPAKAGAQLGNGNNGALRAIAVNIATGPPEFTRQVQHL